MLTLEKKSDLVYKNCINITSNTQTFQILDKPAYACAISIDSYPMPSELAAVTVRPCLFMDRLSLLFEQVV